VSNFESLSNPVRLAAMEWAKAHLSAKQAELSLRLDKGAIEIKALQARDSSDEDEQLDDWEVFYTKLLHRFEAISAEIRFIEEAIVKMQGALLPPELATAEAVNDMPVSEPLELMLPTDPQEGATLEDF